MTFNVDKLRDIGFEVTATVNKRQFVLPEGLVLEIHFERGKFPQELHDALRSMMPGQQIEADIIGEHTMGKVNDFLLLKAINDTAESK